MSAIGWSAIAVEVADSVSTAAAALRSVRLKSTFVPEAAVRRVWANCFWLADRTAAYEEKAAVAEEKLARQQRLMEDMKAMPAPEPERMEVAVIPSEVTDTLAELAARAEAIAEAAEEKLRAVS